MTDDATPVPYEPLPQSRLRVRDSERYPGFALEAVILPEVGPWHDFWEDRADAESVALFLQTLGLSPTPQSPIRLDGDFLLELGAALRLLLWEHIGLTIHRGDVVTVLDARGYSHAVPLRRIKIKPDR